MLTPILTALLCLSPSAAPELAREDTFERTLAQYRAAKNEYRAELRKADKERRAELRMSPPGKEFFPRFEALAQKGNGRALFWTAKNINLKGLGIRESREAGVEAYRGLIAKHMQADWFGTVLGQLPRERKYLGEEELLRVFREVSKLNPSRDVQAQALFMLSLELRRSEDPKRQTLADEALARVVKEFSDTKYANNAENDLFTATRLAVGKEAPDFEGTTIDGYEFKLSDYRGKVVLVDFYGFW